MRPTQDTAPPYKALFHPRLDPKRATAWLADPLALIPEGAQAPWRGLSTCDGLFVKYREAGRLASLRPPGSDRFERAMPLGLKLESCQQPVNAPLALIKGPGPGGRPGRWLIMDAIPGRNLAQLVTEGSLDESARVFGRLAGILAHFHDQGFRQRDLKAPNIMVTRAGELLLVDLEGMVALGKPASWKLRAKDLGRLGASFLSQAFVQSGVGPNHWDELLRLYLGACQQPIGEPGPLVEQISLYARKKVERNLASGRPLA